MKGIPFLREQAPEGRFARTAQADQRDPAQADIAVAVACGLHVLGDDLAHVTQFARPAAALEIA